VRFSISLPLCVGDAVMAPATISLSSWSPWVGLALAMPAAVHCDVLIAAVIYVV
jgi:hypothetical protein